MQTEIDWIKSSENLDTHGEEYLTPSALQSIGSPKAGSMISDEFMESPRMTSYNSKSGLDY